MNVLTWLGIISQYKLISNYYIGHFKYIIILFVKTIKRKEVEKRRNADFMEKIEDSREM